MSSSVRSPDGFFCQIETIGETEVDVENENEVLDRLILKNVPLNWIMN